MVNFQSHVVTYGDIAPYGMLPEAIKECGRDNNIADSAIFEGSVFLGDRNDISHYTVFGSEAEHRDRSLSRGWVKIGSDNVIREFTAVQAGWKDGMTVIGNQCYIMDKCHIAHDCDVQSEVTMAPGVVLGGYTIVGVGATLGINSSTHQRSRIGPYSMIGANTFVKGDVPPFAMVVDRGRGIGEVYGLNRKALEELGIEEHHYGWIEDAINLDEWEVVRGVPIVEEIFEDWRERLDTPL